MAAATPVSICSNALRKLGDQAITSLLDNTERARLCNALYEQLRDAVLTEYNWSFSINRQALNQISGFEPVSDTFFFSKAYQLPTDMLLLLETDLVPPTRWKIEGDRLLTNTDTVSISYIQQTVDTQKMGALFIEAFTARIAWELALPVTGQISRYNAMRDEYREKMAIARNRDAGQDYPKQFSQPSLVVVRVGSFTRERNRGEVDPSVGGP